MTATTANNRGQINNSVFGALAATSDATPTFRYRREADGSASYNTVSIVISGTWAGTVTLQGSAPNRDEWATVPGFVWTEGVATGLTLSGPIDLRIIFTSRTSGTVYGHILV